MTSTYSQYNDAPVDQVEVRRHIFLPVVDGGMGGLAGHLLA
jgi:hypothetical protein